MSVFRRKPLASKPLILPARSVSGSSYGLLRDYRPLGQEDVSLYRALREAVPLLDAALIKIIRLSGGFSPQCPRERDTKILAKLFDEMPAGYGQMGMQAFLDRFLDSLLTGGQAVGEMMIDPDTGRLAGVLCGDARGIEVKTQDNPLTLLFAKRDSSGNVIPFPRQDLLLFCALNPEPDAPFGVSILRGLPFLSNVLMKIYQTIGLNWERMGNLRYAVTYKPGEDSFDAARDAGQIAEAWRDTMQTGPDGQVRDFVAVGDIQIKIIGVEGQILDSQTPVRQLLEQLLARTGIPPFMLGLNWSTTERMSSQQADMMTSEITALRRTVTPVLTRVLHMTQSLLGQPADGVIVWQPINLQDDVEEARAQLLRAQAEALWQRGGGK